MTCETRARKADALAKLFLECGVDPAMRAEQMLAYTNRLRNLPDEVVERGIESILRDPGLQRLPTAPAVRAACLRFASAARSGSPRQERRWPPTNHRVDLKNALTALRGAPVDESERTLSCGQCGNEFTHSGHYETRCKKLGIQVLCMPCAGDHLRERGRRKLEESERAWKILRSITRDERVPSQADVDWLDTHGFRDERVSRMGKAGLLTGRVDY